MDQETGADQGLAETPSVPEDEAAAQPAAPDTGDPRVDEALRPLAGLAGKPVADHPGVLEGVHAELVEVLGELGSAAATDG